MTRYEQNRADGLSHEWSSEPLASQIEATLRYYGDKAVKNLPMLPLELAQRVGDNEFLLQACASDRQDAYAGELRDIGKDLKLTESQLEMWAKTGYESESLASILNERKARKGKLKW